MIMTTTTTAYECWIRDVGAIDIPDTVRLACALRLVGELQTTTLTGLGTTFSPNSTKSRKKNAFKVKLVERNTKMFYVFKHWRMLEPSLWFFFIQLLFRRLEWYHDSLREKRKEITKAEEQHKNKYPPEKKKRAMKSKTKRQAGKTERGANIYHSRMLSHVLFMAFGCLLVDLDFW